MNFVGFGFKKFLVDKLNELNFYQPTPVQVQAIPLLKKHRNVIVQAPTGTGKSHAFLLPLINNLNPSKVKEVQLIIVVPTQELGKQLFDNVRFLIEKTEFQVELHTKQNNRKALAPHCPTIIIATPQRLTFLHQNQERILTKAQALVVDEADMVLEQGFAPDLNFLIDKMNDKIQLAFFSATINQELRTYLKKYVKNSFWLEVKASNRKLIKNYLIDSVNQNYWPALQNLVMSLNPFLCLIFVNNKTEIKPLKLNLEKLNLGTIGELHSDLAARSRNQIFKRIRNGDFKYLVVSDLAARGLDIPGVSHVISLGLPKNLDFYWHRSGRTGRNQSSGESYLLIKNASDRAAVKKLERKGIEFIPIKLKQAQQTSIQGKRASIQTTTKMSKSQLQDLKKLNASFAKAKVKPNYKKKQKQAVDKLIKQQRRQEIVTKMRQNKRSRYKKRRAQIFEK